MDECKLNDLLECSVCLERLDTSSKALPCQHTFCRKCLENIVASHKELRCPECRVLVESRIEDLPPNVLLMRILEGMKNAAKPPPNTTSGTSVHHSPSPPSQQHLRSRNSSQHVLTCSQPNTDRNHVSNKSTNLFTNQPHGIAVYDYLESSDINFKKGDKILLKKKVNQHFYLGEHGGKSGLFPAKFVKVHKRRMKALELEPYTIEDSERAAGFGSFKQPKKRVIETQKPVKPSTEWQQMDAESTDNNIEENKIDDT